MFSQPRSCMNRRTWVWLAAMMCLTSVQATETPADKALPTQNLLISLRQVEQVPQDSATVSTRAQRPPLMKGQQILVSNGQSARFGISQGQVLQWSAAVASIGTPAHGHIHNVWLVTGQNLVVQPRLRSGETSVELGLSVQGSIAHPGRSTDLPRVSQQNIETQVRLPLNQWTTVAVTGDEPEHTGQVIISTGRWARALQIRVAPQ